MRIQFHHGAVDGAGRSGKMLFLRKAVQMRGFRFAGLGALLMAISCSAWAQDESSLKLTEFASSLRGDAGSDVRPAESAVLGNRSAEELPENPAPQTLPVGLEPYAGGSGAEALVPAARTGGTEAIDAGRFLPGLDATFSSTMDSMASIESMNPAASVNSTEIADTMASRGEVGVAGVGQPGRPYVPLNQCPYDKTHARECRVHIRDLALSSLLFLAFENGGNVYTGYYYRVETTTGKWWDRYVNSVEDWRWDNWKDNNPFLDDYVGHPMMGAITDSLWNQNDPKSMTLEQSNSWVYYRSKLRALAYSTFYSFEWKLGPIGEASVGHNGDHFYTDKGVYTNETGWVELVTTPIGGLGWTLGEDALDRHVVRRLEAKSRNPILLTLYQFATPSKAFTNMLRFRPPWYRDSRNVKASSFFSDPGEGLTATTAAEMKYVNAHPDLGAGTGSGAIVRVPLVATSPAWEGPGGKHEFGAVWGLSVMTGHVFGYASDVKYMPVDLRYSYELYRHHQAWTLRYAPELTALAMIDWPTPQPIGKGLPGTLFNQRTRAYGSGLSPVGFEADFRPLSRIQPFFRTDGGFIYFDQRVLSPNGSQWMYTIGPDVGLNIYRHQRQTVTIGWRYTHLSNANISLHNPGTDANVFYVGISRFRTKGQTDVPPAR